MTPPSTSDGYRDVRLSLLFILRHQEIDEVIDMIEKLARLLMRIHVFDHSRIRARLRFQMSDKIRIWKKTDIKNEVGIDRDTVFEPKAH